MPVLSISTTRLGAPRIFSCTMPSRSARTTATSGADIVLTLLLPEHTGLGQNLATERAHRGVERDDDPCDRLLVSARRSPRLEENPSHQLVACVPFVRQAIEITRPQPSIEHCRSRGHAGAHIMRWPYGQHARRIGSGRDGRSRSPSFTRLPGGVCSSA